MKTKLFAIYDVKADSYASPFTMPTNGMAIRGFVDLAKDPQTMIGKHPEDYKLVQIGSFDDESGRVVSEDVFTSLGFASEYLNQENAVVAAARANPDKIGMKG